MSEDHSAGPGRLLTVVIPAWDLGDELAECVASVRGQLPGLRILVVDNASSLPLPALEGVEVMRLDARVTLGAARNAALPLIDTELACFMDGDDVLLPGTLAFLVDAIRARPGCVLAAGGIVLWEPRRDVRRPSYFPPPAAFRLQHRPRLLALAAPAVSLLPTVGAAVVRTGVLREVGGFAETKLLENWALGVSLAQRGTVLLSRRPCKLYRVQLDRPMISTVARGERRENRLGRRAVRRRVRGRLRLLLPVYWALHLRQTLRRPRPAPYLELVGLGAEAPASASGRTGRS